MLLALEEEEDGGSCWLFCCWTTEDGVAGWDDEAEVVVPDAVAVLVDVVGYGDPEPTSIGCSGGGMWRLSDRDRMLGSWMKSLLLWSRGWMRGECAGVTNGVWSGVGDVDGENVGDDGAVDTGEFGRDRFDRCCR